MKKVRKVLLAGQTYFISIEKKIDGKALYDEACFEFYQLRLLHCLRGYQVKLHSYLLQSNEVWLLVTPETPFGVDALLRFLNKSYSEYFNRRFERLSAVWKDDFRVSLIQGESLALDCQKWMESLPMTRKLVDHPGAYHWSSYCANSFGGKKEFLTPHAGYTALIAEKSYPGYRQLISQSFDPAYIHYLETRIRSGLAVAKRRYPMMRATVRKRKVA